MKVFADRGGTFTDLIAVTQNPAIIAQLQQDHRFLIVPLANQQWVIVYKLLSENPEQYRDAVIQGIRDMLSLQPNQPLPTGELEVVKMGTTVATNALLERKGDRLVG